MKYTVSVPTIRLLLFVGSTLFLSMVCEATVPSSPKYSLTDLGMPDFATFSEAMHLNDKGQVLIRTSEYNMCVWEDGELTLIDPQGEHVSPKLINDNGTIAGHFSASSSSVAFVWKNGQYKTLGDVPGGQTWTRPLGLNNHNEVCGYSLGDSIPHPPNQRKYAFLWSQDQFDVLNISEDPYGTDDYAWDINNQGKVAGLTLSNWGDSSEAWVWEDGELTFLLSPDSSLSNTSARAITDDGHVFGAAWNTTWDMRPLIWEGETVRWLQPFFPGGGEQINPMDMNNSGIAIGSATSPSYEFALVVWDADGMPWNLNDQLDSSGTGWEMDRIHAINNAGQIAGRAVGTDGLIHAVLLTPIPEPSIVTIDIKPGSDQNPINLGSHGNIPVTIFSTDDFDATTIDPATILLADSGVQTRGKDGDLKFSFKDVDGDGLDDLFIHIDTEGLVLSVDDMEAQLTGETFDGLSISGTDAIKLVGPSVGDFDLDGIVGASDLGKLATYFGTTCMRWRDGDANGDATVDINDLGILATNYGNSLSSVASVPEPGSIALLICGIASLVCWRHGR